MGERGAVACLNAGANDLGGTLMNETITRTAGSEHGLECAPMETERLIRLAGRHPCQRTTLYDGVPEGRIKAARNAAELVAVANTPVKKW